MVTSIILINTERGEVNSVAEQLADMPGVSEVYSVSGNYDLIAMVRVENNDALADLVTNHIRPLKTITQTETMLAFKAYSQHDLEAMFSIGL
ncbi:MAG: Lrp/AsnC ligand binding domain-containing protein [Thiolinea sp.]